MPITGGTYAVPNNFVQQYDLGQKKIRADLVDANFSDVASVINDLIDDDELTVHTNDNQTITGDKTFTGDVTITGSLDISSISASITNQLKEDILKSVFPVGSIYTTTDNTNPASLFGFGTWTQIEGRMIIGVSSSYAVNSTGGEATHTLTVAETPAHTHTRGTMNITGSFLADNEIWGAGAFSTGSYQNYDASSAGGSGHSINFNAANTWTGATSSVGGGGAHNNMPPYYAAYIWRRTA